MSASLWAYTPIECDDEFCVGDCDLCSRAMGHPVMPARKKALFVYLGICPYCRKTLSDEKSDGIRAYRHCFSCNFNFIVEKAEE